MGVELSPAPLLALFAEPHVETLLMYREYFNSAGIEIEEAKEGRDALAKALAHPHDVIVTETRLLGIDGYQLCSLLREDSATRNTPIVVLTADAFPGQIQHANRAGADSVLVKPCMPDVLLHEVERLHRLMKKSLELRSRSEDLSDRVAQQMARSHVLQRNIAMLRPGRRALSKSFARGSSTTPREAPPALFCPVCDQTLAYRDSHIGGVSERFQEQWDYFECPKGCGTFQYRHRTRKVRRVS